MACYHFRIKTDKKPNGMRISSTSHVTYVNREGKFRDIDQQQALGAKSCFRQYLFGDHPIMALPEKPMLLYDSPFGKISLDRMGVHVSQYASTETVAIALSTAQKIFGDEVTVNGGEEFQQKLIFATNAFALGAHFSNIEMEIKSESEKKERESNERGKGIAEGLARRTGRERGGRNSGSVGTSTRSGARKRDRAGNGKRDFQKSIELATMPIDDIAKRTKEALAPGLHLHALPAGHVAAKRGRPHLLLPRDAGTKLLDERRRRDPRLDLRRSVSPGRRDAVNQASDAILKILQKNETGDFAFSHLQYINREAVYEMRGGCVMTGNHLPKWAEGSALRFFHAADRFERANGERYKEIVFSLPNELPIEKSREILDRFLEKHLKDYYYAWAIHEKAGSMSLGERHPHVHIMFSTRELDDLERRQERNPEMFFKRVNKKYPERGGCEKSEKWRGKNRAEYLFRMRQDYAAIQNEVLEKHGVPSRVDALSLEVQKMNAELRGDFVLAEILDRVAERHTDPISIARDDDVVRQQKELRAFNDKRLDAIIKRELDADEKKEQAAADLRESAYSKYDAAMQESFAHLDEAAQKELAAQREKLKAVYDTARALESSVTWGHAAYEEARLEYLDEDGREAWTRAMDLRRDLSEQKRFWDELFQKEIDSDDIDELVARDELDEAVQERLRILEAEHKAAEEKLRPYLAKLSSRDTHKKIQHRIHELLFSNELEKQRYLKSLRSLDAMAKAYKRTLDEAHARRFDGALPLSAMKDDLAMTLAEASHLLGIARHYQYLAIERKQKELMQAKKAVYSYDRIIKIAENIYEHGGVKRLREQEAKYKKQETYLQNDNKKFNEQAQAFHARHTEDTKAYHNEKSALLAERKRLDERARKLETWKRGLDATRAAIEKRRDTPEAEAKIQRIALGIMKKNRPAVENLQRVSAELRALEEEHERLIHEDEVVTAVMAKKGDIVHRSAPLPHADARGKGGGYGDAASHPAGQAESGGHGGAPARSRIEHARAVARDLDMQHGALIARDKKDNTLEEDWRLISRLDQEDIEEEESHGR